MSQKDIVKKLGIPDSTFVFFRGKTKEKNYKLFKLITDVKSYREHFQKSTQKKDSPFDSIKSDSPEKTLNNLLKKMNYNEEMKET